MSDAQPMHSHSLQTQTDTGEEVKAYKAFKQETRKIVHTFTKQAGSLVEAIDHKHAEDIERKIQAS